jgi:hypothetical protein
VLLTRSRRRGRVGEECLGLGGRKARGAFPGLEGRPEPTEQRKAQRHHYGPRAIALLLPPSKGRVQTGLLRRPRRFFHAYPGEQVVS